MGETEFRDITSRRLMCPEPQTMWGSPEQQAPLHCLLGIARPCWGRSKGLGCSQTSEAVWLDPGGAVGAALPCPRPVHQSSPCWHSSS